MFWVAVDAVHVGSECAVGAVGAAGTAVMRGSGASVV